MRAKLGGMYKLKVKTCASFEIGEKDSRHKEEGMRRDLGFGARDHRQERNPER